MTHLHCSAYTTIHKALQQLAQTHIKRRNMAVAGEVHGHRPGPALWQGIVEIVLRVVTLAVSLYTTVSVA